MSLLLTQTELSFFFLHLHMIIQSLFIHGRSLNQECGFNEFMKQRTVLKKKLRFFRKVGRIFIMDFVEAW